MVVVDQAGAHPLVSDARVQLPRLVVRRHRDRVPVAGAVRDRLLHVLDALVQYDQAEGVQPVEQQRWLLAGAHPHGEFRVLRVGEAVHRRHVEHVRREPRGHVQHAPASDRGELCPVPDQGEGRAGLVRDGEQGERGVLVEHPGLVDHDPLAMSELPVLRWAGVRRARFGVGLAQGQPAPHAVAVPPPPMFVDELRHTVRCHAEFLVGDVGGLLRRRDDPGRPSLCGGGFDRGRQHRGLARASGALHDHERIGRGNCGGRLRLLRVEVPRARQARHVRHPARLGACSRSEHVAQTRLDHDDMQRGQVRNMLGLHRVGRQHRQAIFDGEPGGECNEVAQQRRLGAHAGLGDHVRDVLLDVVHRPRRCSSSATIQRAACYLLHAQVIQRHRRAHWHSLWLRGVAGFLQLGTPGGLAAELRRLLMRALVIPRHRGQPRHGDWAGLLPRMRRTPLRLEPGKVAGNLFAPLRHHGVVGLQLCDLARHRVECEPVGVKDRGELRMRGDDRRAEGTDRSLLPEQRRRVQTPPRTRRPHAGPDLEVDVPVRVASPRGLVDDRDGFQLLNRNHLLPTAWPDTGDGVLAEPGPDLAHRVPLRGIQRLRHLRMQRGRDRQRLRGVHHHLREPRAALSPLARLPRGSHRLPRERVDPVDPLRVLIGRQRALTDHETLAVDHGEPCQSGPALQVILISTRPIRLQVTAGIRA